MVLSGQLYPHSNSHVNCMPMKSVYDGIKESAFASSEDAGRCGSHLEVCPMAYLVIRNRFILIFF